MKVRTRFAPSPTGFLHVGGMRTAVFAWLVARHSSGQFILRLEDTDKKREVEGSDQHIIDCLDALGLDYDEGPFRQSERLEVYKEWAQKLVDAGRAYADPYPPEEVQQFREEAAKDKQPFLYRDHRPANPPAWDGSQPLRFKSDPKAYQWHDAVMGDLSTGPEVVDDFILIKSDGYPTYNFAHIIDDHLMEVSHVIRGQEFIASVPNYLNLQEALGIEPPIMATVPHVLAADGQKKLSKRDGAKDVLDYIREGFLPDALVNFIASLGWNDGTTKEIYSQEELIKAFSLERVQRSGAHFDAHRLEWMNGVYIRDLPLDFLFTRTLGTRYTKPGGFWPPEAADYNDAYKKQVLNLVQERLKYFAELPELTRFFFVDLPINPVLISTHKQLKKLPTEELKNMLEQTKASLADSDFSAEDIANRLNQLLEQTGQKPAVLFSLIRIATTQAPASPGLADSLTVLGKDRSLKRIDQQLAALAR